MKKILSSVMLAAFVAASFMLASCNKDDDDNNGSPTPISTFAPANDSFGLCTLQVVETGGPTNQWYFATQGDTGNAELIGVMSFPYSYNKTGNNTSVLIFNVGGSDRYDMTWTTDSSGSFQESFEGNPGNPGTFVIRD